VTCLPLNTNQSIEDNAPGTLDSPSVSIARTTNGCTRTRKSVKGGRNKPFSGAVCMRSNETSQEGKKGKSTVRSSSVQKVWKGKRGMHKAEVEARLNLPKTLKICGSNWSIDYVNSLLGEWGLHGRTNPSGQSILVGIDQHPEMALRTLLHEALHACLAVSSGHGLHYEHEETVIRCLEPALLSLLRDNPVLVDLLAGKTKVVS
jgi:hypothetical protein